MMETSNRNNLMLIDALREKEIYLYDALLRQQDAPYSPIVHSESTLSFRDEMDQVI